MHHCIIPAMAEHSVVPPPGVQGEGPGPGQGAALEASECNTGSFSKAGC